MMSRITTKFIIVFFSYFFCFARCLPVSAQDIGFYFKKNRQKVTIPVEVYNNLIVLPVKLNDGLILRFILDTGARSTILFDKSLADSLGMTYLREIEIFGAGSQLPIAALVADGVSMSMPGISSSRISAVVLKEDFVQLERHLGTKIHGLIGYDIFSRFVVKIDYRRERITLYDPEKFSVKKKYNTVNLEVWNGKPNTDLCIHFDEGDCFSGKLMVDTGATHALALDRNSSEKIELPGKYISASLGRGLSGEIAGYIGRIQRVELGENSLEGVITSFTENIVKNDDNENLRHGSIGGELLKKFTVVFDFVQGSLHLKPNNSYNQPFEYNMSGLEFTAHGEKLDTYLIDNIRAESAADKAGLMPGDVLVSLNNMPSARLNLSRIYDELNSKADAKIDLTVLRDGKFISKTMFVEREL